MCITSLDSSVIVLYFTYGLLGIIFIEWEDLVESLFASLLDYLDGFTFET